MTRLAPNNGNVGNRTTGRGNGLLQQVTANREPVGHVPGRAAVLTIPVDPHYGLVLMVMNRSAAPAAVNRKVTMAPFMSAAVASKE